MLFSFPKSERLRHRQIIETLVRSGQSVSAYPLRLVWLACELPEPVPVQAAFSVPKRRFKRAVDRNLIKRLMREAWRLQRPGIHALCEGKQFAVLLLYTGDKTPTQAEVHARLTTLLAKWTQNLNGLK